MGKGARLAAWALLALVVGCAPKRAPVPIVTTSKYPEFVMPVIPPDSVDPTVKNFHWGDLVRGLFEAYDRDAWLPILTDGEGNVTEGPGFNVFALANGALHTPEQGVLEGITRKTAIEIAGEQGLDVHVGMMPVSLLYEAGEIFLTSTAGGVMPVATLDGKAVGSGVPGPTTTAIRDRYWALHDDPRFTRAVDYEAVPAAGPRV